LQGALSKYVVITVLDKEKVSHFPEGELAVHCEGAHPSATPGAWEVDPK
jgi:hypothetical protein